MIILDEEGQPQSKLDVVAGPTIRLPERASTLSRSSLTLPDYETSQAQSAGLFDKLTIQKKIVKYRIDSRFWRAALYALIIYVLLTVIVGVPIIVTKMERYKPDVDSSPPPVRVAWQGQSLDPNSLNTMTASLAMQNGTVCDKWSIKYNEANPSPFSVQTNYSFPLFSSQPLVIQSNLSFVPSNPKSLSGNLTVDYNADPSIATINVHLSLQSSSLSLVEKTHVCFSDVGSNRGLSIYVPDYLSPNDTMSFSIQLLFPRSSLPIVLGDFATSLPLFRQQFGNLANLTFGSVTIQGSQADFSFQSLNANRLSVKNSFGTISGKFKVTGSLNLDNIEGLISSTAVLVQQPGNEPPIFQIDTGNGELLANVIIDAPPSSNKDNGGYPQSFSGQVKTFSAPLSLNVSYTASTPSTGTTVCLSVYNSQAVTNVTMDAKYAGLFNAQTKLADIEVATPSTRDPSGKNRPRIVAFDTRSPSYDSGYVGWGSRPPQMSANQGSLQVTSSLGPINIHFGVEPP